MGTTMQIRVRVPARRMKKVQALFADMGTDITSAVNMFLAQVELTKRIPFDITSEVPNAATRAAIREAEDPDLPAYTNVEDLMVALKKK